MRSQTSILWLKLELFLDWNAEQILFSKWIALPDDTNDVEAHHHFAMGHCIESLSVAMMAVYKQDVAVGQQYLVKQHGLAITYEDKTPAS